VSGSRWFLAMPAEGFSAGSVVLSPGWSTPSRLRGSSASRRTWISCARFGSVQRPRPSNSDEAVEKFSTPGPAAPSLSNNNPGKAPALIAEALLLSGLPAGVVTRCQAIVTVIHPRMVELERCVSV
jgi:hypothetical protein